MGSTKLMMLKVKHSSLYPLFLTHSTLGTPSTPAMLLGSIGTVMLNVNGMKLSGYQLYLATAASVDKIGTNSLSSIRLTSVLDIVHLSLCGFCTTKSMKS